MLWIYPVLGGEWREWFGARGYTWIPVFGESVVAALISFRNEMISGQLLVLFDEQIFRASNGAITKFMTLSIETRAHPTTFDHEQWIYGSWKMMATFGELYPGERGWTLPIRQNEFTRITSILSQSATPHFPSSSCKMRKMMQQEIMRFGSNNSRRHLQPKDLGFKMLQLPYIFEFNMLHLPCEF